MSAHSRLSALLDRVAVGPNILRIRAEDAERARLRGLTEQLEEGAALMVVRLEKMSQELEKRLA